MVAPVLPRPQAQVVSAAGYAQTEWYDFWRLLSQLVDAGIVTQAEFDALVARVAALEDAGSLDFTISGTQSVRVLGTPAGGVVQLMLDGDSSAPGNSYYYGTNASGAKGYHPLPDPTPSMLPIVTGEIASGQPVFVYGPDGSLIFGPVP